MATQFVIKLCSTHGQSEHYASTGRCKLCLSESKMRSKQKANNVNNILYHTRNLAHAIISVARESSVCPFCKEDGTHKSNCVTKLARRYVKRVDR